MRFSGSLADLALIDVLQVMQVTQRTGALIVHGQTGEAVVVLREGLVIACRHPNPEIRIGNLLVEAGATGP
jgi:hypothetical protein